MSSALINKNATIKYMLKNLYYKNNQIRNKRLAQPRIIRVRASSNRVDRGFEYDTSCKD